MHKTHRYLAVATLSVALISVIAHAAPPQSQPEAQRLRAERIDRTSPDLLPSAAQRRLSLTATQAASGKVAAAAAPTVEEVGDVDSFRRPVRWLGVTQGNVNMASTCPPPSTDPTPCVALNAAPASTSFDFDDIASITLPGKSAHSLLCYWFSPYLNVSYHNPTASPDVAQLAYFPTLTIESEVLDDPVLIDPGTGLPFGGELLTGMTSSEIIQTPLAAGQQLDQVSRDSAVCIAGFLTRRNLVLNFGLTEAQATQFFKKPITVRLNVSGNVRFVQNAGLVFGLRIVGD